MNIGSERHVFMSGQFEQNLPDRVRLHQPSCVALMAFKLKHVDEISGVVKTAARAVTDAAARTVRRLVRLANRLAVGEYRNLMQPQPMG